MKIVKSSQAASQVLLILVAYHWVIAQSWGEFSSLQKVVVRANFCSFEFFSLSNFRQYKALPLIQDYMQLWTEKKYILLYTRARIVATNMFCTLLSAPTTTEWCKKTYLEFILRVPKIPSNRFYPQEKQITLSSPIIKKIVSASNQNVTQLNHQPSLS